MTILLVQVILLRLFLIVELMSVIFYAGGSSTFVLLMLNKTVILTCYILSLYK